MLPLPARALCLPLPSEAALDETLLELSCPESRAAEIFVERNTVYTAACELRGGGSRFSPGVLRADQGIGLRLMLADEVRAGHVGGADAEEVQRLARDLASGRVDPAGLTSPALERGQVERGEPGQPTDCDGLAAGLAEIVQQAEAATRGIPGFTLELRLKAALRDIHVVSSEWGHAADTQVWTSLSMQAEQGGQSFPSVRRGLGLASWGLPRAEEVSEALDELLAAAERGGAARPVPPGSPGIVLAAEAGGVLIHEAIGHALEGDVVERGASVFRGFLGEQVAPWGMTVIDDPSLPGRAGTHLIDDEGSPSRPLALIEDGILRATLMDVQRAGFSAERCSGHGRRASYRDLPLPRMANTYLAPGSTPDGEVIEGLASGLLVTQLERGMADPVSGDFRLHVTEGWLVEAGRRLAPLRPFTLSGNTRTLLAGVEAVGDVLGWDDGCGTCGREDQWLRVSAGQPSLRLAEGTLGVG